MIFDIRFFLAKRIFFLFIFFQILSCATYWENRKNDFQDIFTAGVERPAYGAGIRISLLPMGFFFQGERDEEEGENKGIGTGVRGGSVGNYYSTQLLFGFLGGETFYYGEVQKDEAGKIQTEEKVPVVAGLRDNLKSHNIKYWDVMNTTPKQRQKENSDKLRKYLAEQIISSTGDESLRQYIPPEKRKPYGYPKSYAWQLEMFLGLRYSVRLGFNIAEFADFLLGFTSYDLLGDDVSGKTLTE